jgi:hypothetical protein
MMLLELYLFLALLGFAVLLTLPRLLLLLARYMALRLWFGSLKRAREAAEALSGVREREAELISRGIDPKTARRLARS